ncbi:MAG: hypothetical protein ACR2RF_03575 [Geminicoccaceae bacterium]
MFKALAPRMACLSQQGQSMPGGFVADLHPDCDLLNGDETIAVDPSEYQPIALEALLKMVVWV